MYVCMHVQKECADCVKKKKLKNRSAARQASYGTRGGYLRWPARGLLAQRPAPCASMQDASP